MIVVDASVAAMWFLDESHSHHARVLLSSAYQICAPDLLHVELGHVLLRAIRFGMLSEFDGDQTIRTILPNTVRLLPTTDYAHGAFDLAARFGGSVYDATYLALGAELGAPVITNDKQMLKTATVANIKAHAIAEGPPKIA